MYYHLAVKNDNNKWGFYDKSGKIIVPIQFPEVAGFSECINFHRSKKGIVFCMQGEKSK